MSADSLISLDFWLKPTSKGMLGEPCKAAKNVVVRGYGLWDHNLGACPASSPLADWSQSSWPVEEPGSARRMVVEPGLQVARLCEIEQVLRQLLQLL